MRLLPPPGPGRTRQLALLAVVLIAAVYAVSRMLTTDTAGPSLSSSNTQTRPTQGLESPKVMPQPLELDKLDPAPEAPTTTRNPFGFGARPAPAPSPSISKPPTAPPSIPTQPPALSPPRVPLTFIGRVVMPGREIVAVLADDRGNRYSATEGQIVDGRYRVLRIGEESAVVEFVNGSGRTTLQLKGS
jgi:hypothetical protein